MARCRRWPCTGVLTGGKPLCHREMGEDTGKEVSRLRNSHDQSSVGTYKLRVEESNGPALWRAGQVRASSGRQGGKGDSDMVVEGLLGAESSALP